MSVKGKIYTSQADLEKEQSELTVLRDTESYLKDERDNPESDTQEEIAEVNEEINRLKQQLKDLQQILKEDSSEYESLWKQNTKLYSDARKFQRKYLNLKLRRNLLRSQALVMELQAQPNIFMPPLPSGFSHFNAKHKKRVLKDRAERQRQIDAAFEPLRKNQSKQQQLTEEVTKNYREYTVNRTAQEQTIAKIKELIAKRQPTQTEVNTVRGMIQQRQNRKSKILNALRIQLENIKNSIDDLADEISRKVISQLQRLRLNFYIIVREKTVDYERTYREGQARTHGKTVQRKYPKGKFQALMDCDGFMEPNNEVVMVSIDPLKTLIPLLQESAAEIINARFHLEVGFQPEDFTIGVTNVDLGTDDLGTPPVIVQIARTTNDEQGSLRRDSRFSSLNGKDWSREVHETVMTQEEYNELIEPMTDYVGELKRLGKFRRGLI